MTTYYVGPGGNDGNAGTSWGARKLTLNGAEDIPVAAGDTVYVGPGVYRELLTVDVSGSSGNPITYIADITGENTDGVGGVVRITGSDDDQTATRASVITASSKNYRTFRGFMVDTTTSTMISGTSGTNWIIESCTLMGSATAISLSGSSHTVRRCVFYSRASAILTGTGDNTGNVIENCIFNMFSSAIIPNAGGTTIKNCLFMNCETAIRVTATLTAGQTVQVNNCIFAHCSIALRAATLGDLVENYNCLYNNSTDRTSVNTGANSVSYPPLFAPPLIREGIPFPIKFGELSQWSQVRGVAGTGEPSDDFFGTNRPVTSSKNSWGPIQFQPVYRETAITQGSSAAAVELADAGYHQIFVPVAAESTTISVYAYREADYAGTNPQMIIRQPGQADRTTTDAGSAAQFNQLTDTFTPAASPPYVLVLLKSNNTATSGSYATYFDTLAVS